MSVLPNGETAEAPEPTDDSTLPPPVPIDIILSDVISTVSVSHPTGNSTKIASIAIQITDNFPGTVQNFVVME